MHVLVLGKGFKTKISTFSNMISLTSSAEIPFAKVPRKQFQHSFMQISFLNGSSDSSTHLRFHKTTRDFDR